MRYFFLNIENRIVNDTFRTVNQSFRVVNVSFVTVILSFLFSHVLTLLLFVLHHPLMVTADVLAIFFLGDAIFFEYAVNDFHFFWSFSCLAYFMLSTRLFATLRYKALA